MTGRRAAAAGGRAQGAYEIFEDTDAPGVAQCLQPHEHRFTVHQMILTDPASDLVVVGIQLRPAAGTRLRLGRAAPIATHRVPRDPNSRAIARTGLPPVANSRILFPVPLP